MTSGPRASLSRGAARLMDLARRSGRFVLRLARAVVRPAVLAWGHRSALTVPIRWRWLRSFDRPAAFLLRLEPRMLSSRVSVTRVPFQGTLPERLRLWLWEKHSVGTGLFLCVLVGIGMCLVSLVSSSLFTIPMLGLQSDVDGIPTMIIGTAAYLGGLFGFLQAVTIFAVQLRSQQDTSMLPLTPLIARRYFTFLVLGAIAGVTIANLLAALAAPVLPVSRSALGALSWLNLAAVPAATVAAFWYLAKIVSEAGEADMEVALPVLRATMRAQTLADARQVALLNEYGRCLDAAGIKFDPFADSRLHAKSATRLRIVFGEPGTACDLDCHRLSKVARLLRAVTSTPQAAVTIAIGQSLQSDNAMILTWESSSTPTAATSATAPMSEELQGQLRAALAGVFLVRKGNGT